ncbi:MAG TPA: cyclic nucleotide-binding domain-containing protein, partial [Cyclobacteriaceae bacterium]
MQTFFEHINQHHRLSKSAQESLSEVLNEVSLPKGSFLITESKVCQHLYFLEKGCLRGFYNLDGKEVTYWFGFENTFVTSFYSFITKKPSVENIQLIEDCILW